MRTRGFKTVGLGAVVVLLAFPLAYPLAFGKPDARQGASRVDVAGAAAELLAASAGEQIADEVRQLSALFVEIVELQATDSKIGGALDAGVIEETMAAALIAADGLALEHAEVAQQILPHIRRLRQLTERLRDSVVAMSPAPWHQETSPGFPDAPYSEYVGDARISYEAVHQFRLLVLAVQILWSFADRTCATVSEASLLCVLADVTLYLAQFGWEWQVAHRNSEVDSSEILGSYARLAHLHEDITSAVDAAEGIHERMEVLEQKIDALMQKMSVTEANVDAMTRALEQPR